MLTLQEIQAQDAKPFAKLWVVLTGSNGPWTVDVSFDHSSATYKLGHFDQDLYRLCALYIYFTTVAQMTLYFPHLFTCPFLQETVNLEVHMATSFILSFYGLLIPWLKSQAQVAVRYTWIELAWTITDYR